MSARRADFEVELNLGEQETSHIALRDLPLVEIRGMRPVRRFGFFKEQKRNPGWYFATTTKTHVPHESRLERANLELFDFDEEVVWIVAQPFRLRWRDGRAKRSHVPDFLLKLKDGTVRIANVALPERAVRSDVAERLSAMSRAAAQVGWEHEVFGAPSVERLRRVRLLATCRVEPFGARPYFPVILERLAVAPRTIAEIEAAFEPYEIRPALLHLLWHRRVTTDLNRPLRLSSVLELGSETGVA